MSAASGSCDASSETAYSNRFETGWFVSSETPEVASSSSSSCSNADSSVRRTSPNCRVIESMGSFEILACGQAHQLAVVRHHERAIGRMQITYGSVALLVDGEDGMSFRHGLAWIHDVETSEPVIRQRAQRFAPDFHAFAVMPSFHVVPSTLTVHCRVIRRSSLTVVGLPFALHYLPLCHDSSRK